MYNKSFLLLISFGFLSVGMEQKIKASSRCVREWVPNYDAPRYRSSDYYNFTANQNLTSAFNDNNLLRAQQAIDDGADVDTTAFWSSRLFIAYRNNKFKMLKLLLKNNAYVSPADRNPRNSVGKDFRNRIEIALDEIADENLLTACQDNNRLEVKKIIRTGPDINTIYCNGKTPLMFACEHGNLKIITILLRKGATVNTFNPRGQAPLLYACGSGNPDAVKMLLAHDAEVNTCDNNGLTPLAIACSPKNLTIVTILLENGAQIPLDLDETSSAVIEEALTICNMDLREQAQNKIAEKISIVLKDKIPNKLIPYDVMGVVASFLPPTEFNEEEHQKRMRLKPRTPPVKATCGCCCIS